MLTTVIVAEKDYEAEKLSKRLSEAFKGRVDFVSMPMTRDIIGEIRKRMPDLLITLDLAGFDRTTYTDGVAYNLLDCKQIHLLLHEKLSNEKYLGSFLSIAMFFACAGEAYEKSLKYQYSNIPWLKTLPVLWDEGNREAENEWTNRLCSLIEEVLQECRLI